MDTILLVYAPRRPFGRKDAGVGSHHPRRPMQPPGALGELATGLNHRMDATCRHAGILHATGIRFGGSWIYPHQEYRQRTDEESD